MRYAMMSYISSQNEQDLPSIQDQILSTLPIREPIRPISANINRQKQYETPIDQSPANHVRRNQRLFHNCNDDQDPQLKNLVNSYNLDVSNSDCKPVSHGFSVASSSAIAFQLQNNQAIIPEKNQLHGLAKAKTTEKNIQQIEL